jgi:DNA/RNA endonuclease YhcR with UshA esterase domain
MRFLTSALLLAAILAIGGVCSARNTSSSSSSHDCVSFAEASKHVGTSACVRGTVLHVETGTRGVTLLNFCQDPKACPFTVVVFPADLKKMGDVRQLEGRQVEIKGTIQDYDGRAEIILRRTQQLGEGAFLLFPTVPTDYDVERAGKYSPGKFKHPKAAKKSDARQGDPVPLEDSDEP